MSVNGSWFDNLSINLSMKSKEGDKLTRYSTFDSFVKLMREKLDRTQWYTPIAYTPHDFSHHIRNVLQYGSKILNGVLDYFTFDDLLVFQYACVLHDIDMVYNPYGREIHSFTANTILDNFAGERIDAAIQGKLKGIVSDVVDMADCGTAPKDAQTELISQIHSSLSQFLMHMIEDESYRKAIGQIILGHSDIKHKGGKINTLAKEFYLTSITGSQEYQKIKTRILSATLRFADELDCSALRINGISFPMIPPEGRKYWERLKLISNVDISMPNIKLEIDCDYIKNSADRNECYAWLQEVHDKIENERTTVVQCYEEEGLSLNIAAVKLSFPSEVYRKEYEQFVEESKKKRRV